MKLMARRNSMITSIGKSRWNMSVCITVLKNSIVFLFFFFLLVLVSSCRRSSTINTPNGEYKMIDCQEINGGKFKLSSIASYSIPRENINLLLEKEGAGLMNICKLMIFPFSKQDSILLYRIYLDNKIYEMQSDHRIKVAYEVNFGEESIDFEDLEDIPHREVKKKLANSRGKIKYLTENRNYIQLIFFDKQMPCVAVYDKRQGVTRSYTFENCVDDLTGLQYPLFEFTKGQDEFIAILSPMDIENAGSELTEKGKAVFKDVNFVDDDNPILYIVKTE